MRNQDPEKTQERGTVNNPGNEQSYAARAEGYFSMSSHIRQDIHNGWRR